MTERDRPPARRCQATPEPDSAPARLWAALDSARRRDKDRLPSHGDRLTVGVRADDLEWALVHISHIPRRSA